MLGSHNGEILTSLIHLENLDHLTQIFNISGYLNIVYIMKTHSVTADLNILSR